MFIAIPKCISKPGWKNCLITQSKGQAKRIIIQCDLLPEHFDIVEIEGSI